MSRPACLALVLAGSRGPDDPVARAGGVSHKAFISVAGRPMLLRVVEALAASRSVDRIVVCIERPDLIDTVPELAALRAAGNLAAIESAGTPSLSVLHALTSLPHPVPMLVTTADHALLTPAMIDYFWTSLPTGADVAAGVATSATISTRYPETRRTYLRFSDTAVSGCNLFAFTTPAAKRAAEIWMRVERNRKQPWRIVALLGPAFVLRFVLRRLSLAAALAALSRRTGLSIATVDMPFAEAANDVDKPADLELVETILSRG